MDLDAGGDELAAAKQGHFVFFPVELAGVVHRQPLAVDGEGDFQGGVFAGELPNQFPASRSVELGGVVLGDCELGQKDEGDNTDSEVPHHVDHRG